MEAFLQTYVVSDTRVHCVSLHRITEGERLEAASSQLADLAQAAVATEAELGQRFDSFDVAAQARPWRVETNDA